MKKLFVLFSILISNFTSAQNKIDVTYFTLGIVDDYLGRDLVIAEKKHPLTVDYMHNDEIGIIKYLDSLIKNENLIRKNNSKIDFVFFRDTLSTNCGNCNEFYYLYSKKLSKVVNKLYYTKPVWGQEGIQKKDLFYESYIDEKKIKTKAQKISFLLGTFLRFGHKNLDVYDINLANSNSKFDVFRKILMGLEIREIELIEENGFYNTIPCTRNIKFKILNPDLAKKFDKLLEINKKIRK